MTAYYPFWVLLIALSLLASLGGFLWAYRHRQFGDQERARYLPLRNEVAPAAPNPGRRVSREVVAMCAVLFIGVVAMLVTLVTVLLKQLGGGP
jgi:hypothetical protein